MSPHATRLASFAAASVLTLGALVPMGGVYAASQEDIIGSIDTALANYSTPDRVLRTIEEVDKQLPKTHLYHSLKVGSEEVSGLGRKKVIGSNNIINNRYSYHGGEEGLWPLSTDRATLSLALDVQEGKVSVPDGMTMSDYRYYDGMFLQEGGNNPVVYTDDQQLYEANQDLGYVLWSDSRIDQSYEEMLHEATSLDAYKNSPVFQEFIDTEYKLFYYGYTAMNSDFRELGVEIPELGSATELTGIYYNDQSAKDYVKLVQAYAETLEEIRTRKCASDMYTEAYDEAYCQDLRNNFYIAQPEMQAFGLGGRGAEGLPDVDLVYGSDESLKKSNAELVAAATELKDDFLASMLSAVAPAEESETTATEEKEAGVKAPKAGIIGSELSATIAKCSAIAAGAIAAIAGAIFTAKRYLFSPLKRRK